MKCNMAPNTDADDRAFRALTDVIEVEEQAPGLMRVVTWSDEYMVDARDAGCNCPDKQYRDDVHDCKHDFAAIMAANDDVPTPYNPETPVDYVPVATDGGDRPDDCECKRFPHTDDDDLACWNCYDAGFKTVNPDAPKVTADDDEAPDELGDIETVPAAWRDGDSDERLEPTRHEPADFGGGETTGVQDL